MRVSASWVITCWHPWPRSPRQEHPGNPQHRQRGGDVRRRDHRIHRSRAHSGRRQEAGFSDCRARRSAPAGSRRRPRPGTGPAASNTIGCVFARLLLRILPRRLERAGVRHQRQQRAARVELAHFASTNCSCGMMTGGILGSVPLMTEISAGAASISATSTVGQPRPAARSAPPRSTTGGTPGRAPYRGAETARTSHIPPARPDFA